jgi:hypothetical protein
MLQATNRTYGRDRGAAQRQSACDFAGPGRAGASRLISRRLSVGG